MLKESRLIKGWMNESQKIGEQIGERKGERKGKLSILQKQLHQKVGGLSPELLLKLQKLNSTQLDNLSLALLTITNQKKLQAWLNNGASKTARKK